MAASQTASQELDDLSAGMNGIAMASQEMPDFDEEEGNFDSSRTLAIQASVAEGADDEFTMKIKLENMTNNYANQGIIARNAICHMLAIAIALEDFRMVCQKLPPLEFCELVTCAISVKAFHAYLEEVNPQIPGYWTFR